jgi:serine/threonine protein kinase
MMMMMMMMIMMMLHTPSPPSLYPTARTHVAVTRKQAVAGIHALRIVHSDLKPANFMLVQGQLKLIDFGIAKAIQGDTTSIARESQASCAWLLCYTWRARGYVIQHTWPLKPVIARALYTWYWPT